MIQSKTNINWYIIHTYKQITMNFLHFTCQRSSLTLGKMWRKFCPFLQKIEFFFSKWEKNPILRKKSSIFGEKDKIFSGFLLVYTVVAYSQLQHIARLYQKHETLAWKPDIKHTCKFTDFIVCLPGQPLTYVLPISLIMCANAVYGDRHIARCEGSCQHTAHNRVRPSCKCKKTVIIYSIILSIWCT